MNDELSVRVISILEDFIQISYCSEPAEDVLKEAREEAEQIIKELESYTDVGAIVLGDVHTVNQTF